MDDQELLREYVERRSERAFRELVDRHMNLVYSVALRQVGDGHLAKDVAQEVFTALALKARQLANLPALEGWLFRATRFAALNLLRREQRQNYWILKAARMENSHLPLETEEAWERLVPLLNQAIGQLHEKDQNVLLLRYFQNNAYKEIARKLGLTEEAAKKRALRSLEKLKILLARRGVALPAAALATLIPLHAVQAAPPGLSASVAAIAASKGLAANVPAITVGIIKLMVWTKTKTAALLVLALLLGTGGGFVAYQSIHSASGPAPAKRVGDAFFKAGGEVKGSGQIPAEITSYLQANLEEPRTFEKAVFPALKSYAKAHQDLLPRTIQDLSPYLADGLSIPPSLDRWQIVGTGTLSALAPHQILLQRTQIGPGGKPVAAIDANGELEIDIPSINGNGVYQIRTQ